MKPRLTWGTPCIGHPFARSLAEEPDEAGGGEGGGGGELDPAGPGALGELLGGDGFVGLVTREEGGKAEGGRVLGDSGGDGGELDVRLEAAAVPATNDDLLADEAGCVGDAEPEPAEGDGGAVEEEHEAGVIAEDEVRRPEDAGDAVADDFAAELDGAGAHLGDVHVFEQGADGLRFVGALVAEHNACGPGDAEEDEHRGDEVDGCDDAEVGEVAVKERGEDEGGQGEEGQRPDDEFYGKAGVLGAAAAGQRVRTDLVLFGGGAVELTDAEGGEGMGGVELVEAGPGVDEIPAHDGGGLLGVGHAEGVGGLAVDGGDAE